MHGIRLLHFSDLCSDARRSRTDCRCPRNARTASRGENSNEVITTHLRRELSGDAQLLNSSPAVTAQASIGPSTSPITPANPASKIATPMSNRVTLVGCSSVGAASKNAYGLCRSLSVQGLFCWTLNGESFFVSAGVRRRFQIVIRRQLKLCEDVGVVQVAW